MFYCAPCDRDLHGSGPAGPYLVVPGPSSACLKYYFTSGCSQVGQTPETEAHQNIYTCKVQISEHLGKAMSFNVDLLEKVDNAILARHYPTTFWPLILILILLLGYNICNSHEVQPMQLQCRTLHVDHIIIITCSI